MSLLNSYFYLKWAYWAAGPVMKKNQFLILFLYSISVNTFQGIWPYVLVTVHKSAETIQGQKLFAEIRY